MALKGNLRDFSITQLLNLINLAQKTGALVIEGPAGVAQVVFREGKLSFARLNQEDGSLAAVLYRSRKINAGQYRTMIERAGRMTDKELGLLLINAGYLTQEDILLSLQQYFVGVIQQLYNWAEGLFHFENNLMPPEDKIAVRLDLESLILEGARKVREREQLQEEIPSLDIALKFTDRPGTNLRNINLGVEEWRVVKFVNPKNSIRMIARAAKMDDFEIRRVVYGLVQAGLVEMVRVEGAPPPLAAKPVLPAQTRTEKKSLINRLINRIRSL